MDASADTTTTPGAQSGATEHEAKQPGITLAASSSMPRRPRSAARSGSSAADTLERVGTALLLLQDHEASELQGAAQAAARLGFLLEEELPQARGLCWLTAHVVERVEALLGAIDEVRDLIRVHPLPEAAQEARARRRHRHDDGDDGDADTAVIASPSAPTSELAPA